MRVPSVGQPLYERRIVREGKMIAERMLAGYDVTANGRFVRSGTRTPVWRDALSSVMQTLALRR